MTLTNLEKFYVFLLFYVAVCVSIGAVAKGSIASAFIGHSIGIALGVGIMSIVLDHLYSREASP